ncbi:hypothetical protein HNY73_007760 [Argiope bruennichi]|uniref:Uncharacterized protein n=1 Tax=Argiope bruennichi TaxID=94029 RepID=A0A8T0FFX5_ARGBR|nr:hypothetical protein HNY73_007760 [Argiope bruennichi]
MLHVQCHFMIDGDETHITLWRAISERIRTIATEHYKHEKSLCHVPSPEVEKELIAGKLLQSVAEKNILQDIRQSLDTSSRRKCLIMRKDLQNTMRDFGIMLPSRGSVIQDDEISVCVWVHKMKSKKDNPVLFYKRSRMILCLFNSQYFK